MEYSNSYDSCSTGDSYGPINRMADFDMDRHHMTHRYAKYRSGDTVDGSRFYTDNTWPMYGGHRDNGSRFLPDDQDPRDYPNDAHAGMNKFRQLPLTPQRRAGDQFDHTVKQAKPDQTVTQRGVKLGSAWTYWHIAAAGGTEEDWKAGMKPMCTFDYKEQFWGMWNSIKPPSELGSKRELALFRGGLGHRPVWPDWNDSENVDGGRWKIIFRVTELPQIVDNFWRDLMVHCIEERWVPYSGFVNGVSITVKGQFYRIYVWLCSSKPAYVEFIRDRAKELLKDIPYVQLDYVTGNGERPQQRGNGPLPGSLPEEVQPACATNCRCCPSVAGHKPCPERFDSIVCSLRVGEKCEVNRN